MAKNERATTPSRAKARPGEISDQIARAMHAYTVVERTCRARVLLAHYADRRVDAAVHDAVTETARLAATCGSVETTARILDLEPDEVRHLIRRAQRRSPVRPLHR